MLTVDTTGFEAMCRDLSHMGSSPFGPTVTFVAGRTLEGAARLTRERSVHEISESVIGKFNNYGDGKYGQKSLGILPRISNAPKAGHKWWVDHSNIADQRTFYIMNGNRKWSNARWARYTAEVANQVHDAQAFFVKAKGSRGLAKNSWYQIGLSLGLDINVRNYVKNARPSNGKTYINGRSQTVNTKETFFIDLFNDLPALSDIYDHDHQYRRRRLDGAGILQRAISHEVQYFETLLSKGFFDNVKLRAERYPGVFVT